KPAVVDRDRRLGSDGFQESQVLLIELCLFLIILDDEGADHLAPNDERSAEPDRRGSAHGMRLVLVEERLDLLAIQQLSGPLPAHVGRETFIELREEGLPGI